MSSKSDQRYHKVKRVRGKIHTGEDSLGAGKYNDATAIDCRFANLSTIPLYIVNRLGVVSKINPYHTPPHLGVLLCRMEMRNYPDGLYVGPGHESELNNTLRNNIAANRGGGISIEESINVEDIIKSRSGVYIQNFDIYVTQHEEQALEYGHPNCEQKIHNDYIRLGVDYAAEHVVQVGVRVVDNDGQMGPVFTVIHGKVMQIIPVETPELESGLYVTGFNAMSSPSTSNIREDVFYSFEEVEKGLAPVKLYKHFLDAQSSIEELSIRAKELELESTKRAQEHKERIDSLKRDWDLEKHSMEMEKRKTDETLLMLERKYDKLKAEREEELSKTKFDRDVTTTVQQMQQQSVKYDLDRRVTEQKQITETVKTVGVIVAAVLSIYAIATTGKTK